MTQENRSFGFVDLHFCLTKAYDNFCQDWSWYSSDVSYGFRVTLCGFGHLICDTIHTKINNAGPLVEPLKPLETFILVGIL